MEIRLLTIGSITHAFKAQEVLARYGIRARVVRLPLGEDKDGCMQGVEVYAHDAQRASALLSDSGIRVTHIRSRKR